MEQGLRIQQATAAAYGFVLVVAASPVADALNRTWMEIVEDEPLSALGAEPAPKGRIPMALDGAIEAETWLEVDELKF